MNARQRSDRASRRGARTEPPRPRDWGRFVLPAGLACLVLLLLGVFLARRQLAPSGETPTPTAASKGGPATPRPRPPEPDEPPLPPGFSPQAAPEDCRREMRQVAIRLCEDFPKDVAALQAAASMHWALGDMLEAVRVWERCVGLDARFAPAYEGLGRVRLLQGDFDLAIEQFRKAIALEPRNRQTTVLLAEALVRGNRMREAADELERFVRSGPAPPMSFAFLGQAYLELDRNDDARRALETAVERMPNARQAHFGLVKVYERLGQPEKAQQHRDKLEQLVEVHREAGRDRVRGTGDPAAVLRDTVTAHKTAAAVYQQNQRIDDAALLWRKAAALDPKDLESLQQLALLYERAGLPARAMKLHQQLREMAARPAPAATP